MSGQDGVQVQTVLANCGELLEGPHWHAPTQTLYFVDIHGNTVHRYRPGDGSHDKIDVGENAGTIITTTSGKLVLAGKCRFSYVDWSTGALTTIAKVDEDRPANRFNDGKCDAKGRFWAGTMGHEEKPTVLVRRQGSLYCLHRDGTVTKHAENIDISNGIAWSEDNKTMYYVDTLTRLIEAFDFNLETGEISNRHSVIAVPEADGWPDGLCIDREGMLWLACFSKSTVNRYNPSTAEKLQTLTFPVTNITSCCFGGPDLDDLYVTSSRAGLSDEVVAAQQPLAGSLFRVTGLGVKGYASRDYAD